MTRRLPILLLSTLIAGTPAAAQTAAEATGGETAAPARKIMAAELDPALPVTDADIADRPYTVIGTVKAGVRKATVFSGNPSADKIRRELWERGRKLGADAIILTSQGKSHITVVSWGKTNATGTAIKWADTAGK